MVPGRCGVLVGVVGPDGGPGDTAGPALQFSLFPCLPLPPVLTCFHLLPAAFYGVDRTGRPVYVQQPGKVGSQPGCTQLFCTQSKQSCGGGVVVVVCCTDCSPQPLVPFLFFWRPSVPYVQIDTTQLWKFTTMERCVRYHLQVRDHLQAGLLLGLGARRAGRGAARQCTCGHAQRAGHLHAGLSRVAAAAPLLVYCSSRNGTGDSSPPPAAWRRGACTSSRWWSSTWMVRRAGLGWAGLGACWRGPWARGGAGGPAGNRAAAHCWPHLVSTVQPFLSLLFLPLWGPLPCPVPSGPPVKWRACCYKAHSPRPDLCLPTTGAGVGISTITGEVRKIMATIMQIDQVGRRGCGAGSAGVEWWLWQAGSRKRQGWQCPHSSRAYMQLRAIASLLPSACLGLPEPLSDVFFLSLSSFHLQDYYPELMWKCVIINAPTTFRWAQLCAHPAALWRGQHVASFRPAQPYQLLRSSGMLHLLALGLAWAAAAFALYQSARNHCARTCLSALQGHLVDDQVPVGCAHAGQDRGGSNQTQPSLLQAKPFRNLPFLSHAPPFV